MKLQIAGIAAAVAFAFAATVQAQSTQTPGTRDAAKPRTEQAPRADTSARKVKDAEEDRIEADAKAAKARCDAMQGNAKDVCMAEAKGKEKVAKAELDAKTDSSPRNQRKVAEVKNDVEYDLAKERCDDQKGDAKNVCQKQAKDKRDQAKRQIREQYAQKPERPAATGSTMPAQRKTEK